MSLTCPIHSCMSCLTAIPYSYSYNSIVVYYSVANISRRQHLKFTETVRYSLYQHVLTLVIVIVIIIADVIVIANADIFGYLWLRLAW